MVYCYSVESPKCSCGTETAKPATCASLVGISQAHATVWPSGRYAAVLY